MNSRVAVLLVVRNGEAWLHAVLGALASQTHRAMDVTVWDNASTDSTARIVSSYPRMRLVRSPENIGVWAAVERMVADAYADHILVLTDVVLAPRYVEVCARALDDDARLGAVQGKLLRKSDPTSIDALGFRMERSRRVTILGHGERDDGRWDVPTDVFGVEGAAPMFRRAALEDCRVDGHIVDPDFRVGGIGYGDDFDLAWRMTAFGWRQRMIPTAIGWHERSTTSDTGRGIVGRIRRRTVRERIPALTRQLDWCNVRLAIVKNDSILDILRDLPFIAVREVAVLGYLALFEPRSLGGVARFVRLLPAMIRRRRFVQSHLSS
ncbi:MAG TPA: glycosyltransferase [Candidatus Paceibacterota bacterium]|nr:glycosyltransferase [Candidatus Paceibacterota bacterium]